MADKSGLEAGKDPLSEAAVSDYLLANPEFFQAHRALLTKLEIPHPAGGAVSLVERQVEVLRGENRRLEQRLVEWMEIARENDRLLGHLHRLAVALLAETGRDARLVTLTNSLQADFEADASALILHDAEAARAIDGARHLAREDDAFAGFAENPQDPEPLCRPLTEAQSQRLFPENGAGLGSAAFIPIGAGGNAGWLIVASAQPKHFHPRLDTTYLVRLGELAGTALRPADA